MCLNKKNHYNPFVLKPPANSSVTYKRTCYIVEELYSINKIRVASIRSIPVDAISAYIVYSAV